MVVWHDDFNDGIIEGWKTHGGNFEIRNGSLVLLGVPLWPNLAVAYHNSSAAFGNWSFDIDGYTPSVWFIASTSSHRNLTGYKFARVIVDEAHSLTAFILYRVADGAETSIAYFETTNEPRLRHVVIRRNARGLFLVYVDRGLAMNVTDDEILVSHYFIFGGYSPGAILDNVVVEGLLPPSNVDRITVILFIAGLLVVVTVIFFEIRTRRR